MPWIDMFWSKPKYVDDRFGELEYSSGCWYFELNDNKLGKISVSVEGSKSEPNELCLKNASSLLKQINEYVENAKSFIVSKDISDFTKGNGELIFDGFHCRENLKLVDLEFGLSNWDDASITVHFKEGKPYELSLGD